jgi:hypothetical protein
LTAEARKKNAVFHEFDQKEEWAGAV